MKPTLFILLVVVNTEITTSAKSWIRFEPGDVETTEISGWITKSGLLKFPNFNPEALVPFEENYLFPNDKNGRLVICKYENNPVINTFFVAIINQKVVEVGTVYSTSHPKRPKHKDELAGADSLTQSSTPLENTVASRDVENTGATSTVDSNSGENAPGLEDAINEAENFAEIFRSRQWKNKAEVPAFDSFNAFDLQFDLEFCFMAENLKILGIYYIRSTESFFFGVPKLQDQKVRLDFMGIHYKSIVEAFRDLKKYTIQRKMLLVEVWKKYSDLERESELYTRVKILQCNSTLAWSDDDEMIIESVKTSNSAENLMIVVKSKDSYVTVAGTGLCMPDTYCKVLFETRADTIDAAQNSLENYFNIAFSNTLKDPKDNWICPWEANDVENEPFLDILTSENFTKEIKKSASFLIPEDRLIYFQKYRIPKDDDEEDEDDKDQTQGIAIYEFMGKTFMIRFLQNGTNPIVTFIGALGTVNEVDGAYQQFFGNFPFSPTLFINGMGKATPVPEEIPNILENLVSGNDHHSTNFQKSFEKWRSSAPNPEDFCVDEATYAPTPFNRQPRVGPCYFYVPFKLNKMAAGNNSKFIILLKLDNENDLMSFTLEGPFDPEDTEGAQALLQKKIQSEHFAAIIKPYIGK